MCGILSDTLILQSATTTEYDVATAQYLSSITELDIKELGSDIIRHGSKIGGRSASDVIGQDLKEYEDGKIKYSVSQIEVDDPGEVLKRKDEFFADLEASRRAGGKLFHALLVTDITQLSSIMLIASEPSFESILGFPKTEEHTYYLKDVVSRKKQLVPLLSELVAKLVEG